MAEAPKKEQPEKPKLPIMWILIGVLLSVVLSVGIVMGTLFFTGFFSDDSELQKELEQHGIQLGDPEAQYEDQSRGQQWTQSNGDNDDFYGSQDFFLSPNQPAEDSQGNRESIHSLDPDFENTQGTLVSWA